MSQAETLLNSLTDEQIASYSATAEEPHIIIGEDRYISVPESLKRIAVENDHNIETVTFECPRYWDDHDLSEMIIYINCKLPDGSVVSFIAENITANSDILYFDWTITRTIAQTKGSLAFLVCAKQTDSEGNEERHWNSELNTEMYISEGLEADVIVEEEYPDIVNQLLERMTVNEGYYGEIQTLTTTATTAASTATTASEAAVNTNEQLQASATEIRNSYANAIKGNVKGEIVRVDDVSPLEHDVSVKVHGKNYLNTSVMTTTESSSDTVYISEVGEGYIVVTTTDSYEGNGYCQSFKTLQELCPGLVAGKTYTINATTEPAAWIKAIFFKDTSVFWYYGTSLTMTEELLSSYVIFYGLNAAKGQETGACKISNIQIEDGEIATAYESYIDPSTTTIKVSGKNLFSVAEGTTGGVTLSKMGDYYVLNGTCTASSNFVTRLGYLPLGNYTLSANNPSHNNIDLNLCDIYSADTQQAISARDNVSYSVSTVNITKEAIDWLCRIRVQNDKVYSNYVIKPQLELSDTATKYEAHKSPKTYTPATDGTVNECKSVNPTMTLYSNTDGITIEAEYNRDTTKMFESYVLTDEAKSEIASIISNEVNAAYFDSKIGDVNSVLSQLVDVEE